MRSFKGGKKKRYRPIGEFYEETVKSSKADALLNVFGSEFSVFCLLMWWKQTSLSGDLALSYLNPEVSSGMGASACQNVWIGLTLKYSV